MKNMMRVVVCMIALLVLCGAITSCGVLKDEDMIGGDTLSKDQITFEADDKLGEGFEMVSEGRVYFHFDQKSNALLVDSKGSLLWLYSNEEGFFDDYDTGDYVRVGHGLVMESYPGQTYAEKIVLLEDGDISSFTDEEWERLSGVFAEPIER